MMPSDAPAMVNDPRLWVTSKDGPLISIILPARNAGRFLAECINSVLEQSWSNWELLIIDNASTDGTRGVASAFKDPRIRILDEPRIGVSAARNRGLAAMRGAFFCLLDADDRLPKDAIRLRHDLFLRFPHAHFADGAMRAFNDHTGETAWIRTPWFIGPPFDALFRLDGSCFSGNTWMVRVVPGYTYRFPEHMHQSEDLAFYLTIARQGSYVSTPREVLQYRIGHYSATSDPDQAHRGYTQLYRMMLQLDPPPSPAQLRQAWKRLRRFMVRDLFRRMRPLAALKARLMGPPSPLP